MWAGLSPAIAVMASERSAFVAANCREARKSWATGTINSLQAAWRSATSPSRNLIL